MKLPATKEHAAATARQEYVLLETRTLLKHLVECIDRDSEPVRVLRRTPDLVDVREAIEHLRSWLAPYRRPGAPPPAFARHVAGLPFLPPARPGRHLASLPRPEPASPALEQVESVSPLAAVLAPPPQVA